jgi:hypothetical protein
MTLHVEGAVTGVGYILCFIGGALVGVIIMALMVAAKDGDRHE